MIIDWTAAPEGTTHATIPNGDPRWYKLADGKVLCWGLTAKEWMPSFFLTVDEIAEAGLTIYANGEQSKLVMLREQRDALLAVQTMGIQLNTPDFLDWMADRLIHVYGESDKIDFVLSLRERALAGRSAIAKCKE